MLLDEIEKSSDIETLQKYIDTVQNSLHNAETHDEVRLEEETATFQSSEGKSPDNNSENIDKNIPTIADSELLPASGVGLKCSLCSVNFKNQRNLSRHIRLGICLQGTFNCTICDHSFASERGLKRHLHRTMCKKRALEENLIPNTSKFIKMEKIHETPEAFVCDKCSYTFSTKAALAQHASSSRCDSNRLQGLSPSEPKLQESFRCHHCKSTLASKAGLAKHLKRGQCRLYPCSDCAQAFRYLHELRAHMRQEHMTDEINTSLAQTFLRMGGLPSMTHSTNILNALSLSNLAVPGPTSTTHKCKICNYTGTCKRSLENHMRMHVRQLKAIGENTKCTQCDFTCTIKDTLLRHYISQHPGLPYFKMAPKGTHIIRSNRLATAGNNGTPQIDASQTAAIMSVIEKLDLQKFGTEDMEEHLSRLSKISNDDFSSDDQITVCQNGTESPPVVVDDTKPSADITPTSPEELELTEVSGDEGNVS